MIRIEQFADIDDANEFLSEKDEKDILQVLIRQDAILDILIVYREKGEE